MKNHLKSMYNAISIELAATCI